MMMAVPVSWHIGSTPPAAMLAFFEEIVGDELVVGGGLGVVEDFAQLLQVRGAQQMIDVGEGGLGQRAQRLVGDHDHLAAHDVLDLTPSLVILR